MAAAGLQGFAECSLEVAVVDEQGSQRLCRPLPQCISKLSEPGMRLENIAFLRRTVSGKALRVNRRTGHQLEALSRIERDTALAPPAVGEHELAYRKSIEKLIRKNDRRPGPGNVGRELVVPRYW